MPIVEATGGMGAGAAMATHAVQQSNADPTTDAIRKAHEDNVIDPDKVRQRIADAVALHVLDQQDAEAAAIDAQRAVRLAAVERDAAIAAEAKAKRDAARAEIMSRQ